MTTTIITESPTAAAEAWQPIWHPDSEHPCLDPLFDDYDTCPACTRWYTARRTVLRSLHHLPVIGAVTLYQFPDDTAAVREHATGRVHFVQHGDHR